MRIFFGEAFFPWELSTVRMLGASTCWNLSGDPLEMKSAQQKPEQRKMERERD